MIKNRIGNPVTGTNIYNRHGMGRLQHEKFIIYKWVQHKNMRIPNIINTISMTHLIIPLKVEMGVKNRKHNVNPQYPAMFYRAPLYLILITLEEKKKKSPK